MMQTTYKYYCTPIFARLAYKFTGKERDTESGNDYFGARYYASSMARFLSPDWSAQEEPVPYANLDNPQTLNLYAYVGNNPLVRVDADGHVTVDGLDEPENLVAAEAQSGALTTQVAQDAQAIADQKGTSGGKGFWSSLGHGLSNLLHGRSWNDDGLREKVTMTILPPSDPIPALTALTDGAGFIATATRSTPLGWATTIGSIWNAPKNNLNTVTGMVGLIPGLDMVGLAGIPSDLFDYGINNSDPNVQPWKGEPILDGAPTGYSNPGGLPSGTEGGGSMNLDAGCQAIGC